MQSQNKTLGKVGLDCDGCKDMHHTIYFEIELLVFFCFCRCFTCIRLIWFNKTAVWKNTSEWLIHESNRFSKTNSLSGDAAVTLLLLLVLGKETNAVDENGLLGSGLLPLHDGSIASHPWYLLPRHYYFH